MKPAHPPLTRVMGFAITVSLPALLIGVGMASQGWLDYRAGLVAYPILVLCLALVMRRRLGALDLLRDHADRLIIDDQPLPESIRQTDTDIRQLASALQRLARAHRDRTDELARKLRAREAVLDAIVDPIMTLDAEGRILDANRGARGMFGAAISGKMLTAVLRSPTLLQAVEAGLAGREGRKVDLQLADPVERNFTVSVEPLPALSPDGTRLILAFHDVTAQTIAEQQRSDFVANVSHELRTPLATLIGFIETLMGPARDDDEARDRFLGIMQDQALRMSRLVNDLLSLSRIELNEHVPPTTSINVADLLERVVHALEVNAAKRNISLDLITTDRLPQVMGDADELQQLFQNLIDNAVKYGASGAPVTIRVTKAKTRPAAMPRTALGALAIAVSDTGEGIPRQHLSRLTERFYRVDPARSRAVGGTGLGLAIVKHIINRHRGALVIESELKKGSTFTVFLPIAAE